jgi:hypothetical protein
MSISKFTAKVIGDKPAQPRRPLRHTGRDPARPLAIWAWHTNETDITPR